MEQEERARYGERAQRKDSEQVEKERYRFSDKEPPVGRMFRLITRGSVRSGKRRYISSIRASSRIRQRFVLAEDTERAV